MRHAETCEPVQPSSVIAQMHRDHLARLQRIKVKAIGQRAIEAAKTDDVQVDLLEKRWAERQKENWFHIAAEISPRRITISEIQRAVMRHFSIDKVKLLADRRKYESVYPRQIGMYLASELTRMGLPEISRHFGRKDHTTSLYASRKIKALVKLDWTVAYDVAHVEAML